MFKFIAALLVLLSCEVAAAQINATNTTYDYLNDDDDQLQKGQVKRDCYAATFRYATSSPIAQGSFQIGWRPVTITAQVINQKLKIKLNVNYKNLNPQADPMTIGSFTGTTSNYCATVDYTYDQDGKRKTDRPCFYLSNKRRIDTIPGNIFVDDKQVCLSATVHVFAHVCDHEYYTSRCEPDYSFVGRTEIKTWNFNVCFDTFIVNEFVCQDFTILGTRENF